MTTDEMKAGIASMSPEDLTKFLNETMSPAQKAAALTAAKSGTLITKQERELEAVQRRHEKELKEANRRKQLFAAMNAKELAFDKSVELLVVAGDVLKNSNDPAETVKAVQNIAAISSSVNADLRIALFKMRLSEFDWLVPAAGITGAAIAGGTAAALMGSVVLWPVAGSIFLGFLFGIGLYLIVDTISSKISYV